MKRKNRRYEPFITFAKRLFDRKLITLLIAIPANAAAAFLWIVAMVENDGTLIASVNEYHEGWIEIIYLIATTLWMLYMCIEVGKENVRNTD